MKNSVLLWNMILLVGHVSDMKAAFTNLLSSNKISAIIPYTPNQTYPSINFSVWNAPNSGGLFVYNCPLDVADWNNGFFMLVTQLSIGYDGVSQWDLSGRYSIMNNIIDSNTGFQTTTVKGLSIAGPNVNYKTWPYAGGQKLTMKWALNTKQDGTSWFDGPFLSATTNFAHWFFPTHLKSWMPASVFTLSNPSGQLATYIAGIGQSLQLINVACDFAVPLLYDFEMLLMDASTSPAKSTQIFYPPAMLCSLTGSKAILTQSNVSSGVYCVFDQPMPNAKSYSLFDKNGKSLGSGNISKIGSVQQGNNAVLIGNCFKGRFLPLNLSGNGLQFFLLQYPTQPASGPSGQQPSNGGSKNDYISVLTQQISTLTTTINGDMKTYNYQVKHGYTPEALFSNGIIQNQAQLILNQNQLIALLNPSK